MNVIFPLPYNPITLTVAIIVAVIVAVYFYRKLNRCSADNTLTPQQQPKPFKKATMKTNRFYLSTLTKEYKEKQWLKFQSPKTKAEQAIIDERVKDVDLTIMRHRYNRKP